MHASFQLVDFNSACDVGSQKHSLGGTGAYCSLQMFTRNCDCRHDAWALGKLLQEVPREPTQLIALLIQVSNRPSATEMQQKFCRSCLAQYFKLVTSSKMCVTLSSCLFKAAVVI